MSPTIIFALLVIITTSCVSFQGITTVSAFTPSTTNVCRPHHRATTQFTKLSVATDPITESSDVSSSSESTEADSVDVTIPTNLPSDCGMDYVPLASMLATGQLAEADQVLYQKFKPEAFTNHLYLL
jgi:hypothetical protein